MAGAPGAGWRSGCGGGELRKKRSSFLQKRSKKLLSALSRTGPAGPRQLSASFLLLFFKKEGRA
jgi:hypothetical protein